MTQNGTDSVNVRAVHGNRAVISMMAGMPRIGPSFASLVALEMATRFRFELFRVDFRRLFASNGGQIATEATHLCPTRWS
jgi:hypothetical protein